MQIKRRGLLAGLIGLFAATDTRAAIVTPPKDYLQFPRHPKSDLWFIDQMLAPREDVIVTLDGVEITDWHSAHSSRDGTTGTGCIWWARNPTPTLRLPDGTVRLIDSQRVFALRTGTFEKCGVVTIRFRTEEKLMAYIAEHRVDFLM